MKYKSARAADFQSIQAAGSHYKASLVLQLGFIKSRGQTATCPVAFSCIVTKYRSLLLAPPTFSPSEEKLPCLDSVNTLLSSLNGTAT